MPDPDAVEEDLHAFALYELATDNFEPYLMMKARREEKADSQKARELYVKLRVIQLKESLDDPSQPSGQILTQGYVQWRREAEHTPHGTGTAWDHIAEQMRSHPNYGKLLHDTGRGMIKQGVLIAVLLVLIVLVGFLIGPVNPGLAIGNIAGLVFVFWLIYGLWPMLRRKD